MTARYRINHSSVYGYDQVVTASFNEARLTPAATRWQLPLESVLRVDQASWQYRYVDYWGTQVRVFEAHSPHRELVIDMTSQVEVDASRRAEPSRELTWTDLRAEPVTDRFGEFLTTARFTAPPPDLVDLAESLAADLSPWQAAEEISRLVNDTMAYLPGSTEVHTLAAEAWAASSGVCQDYAHLVVGALRQVGIPARYVSGYLHPLADASIGDSTAAESHAWVQWWLGEWTDHDPTNLSTVAERHVLVGTGRDYADVPPITGIVAGGPVTSELQVEVTITRVA